MSKKCPHCNVELPALMDSKWEWSCPECSFKNAEHPGFCNCENCGYSPKIALCPFCSKPINLERLFFNFFYNN